MWIVDTNSKVFTGRNDPLVKNHINQLKRTGYQFHLWHNNVVISSKVPGLCLALKLSSLYGRTGPHVILVQYEGDLFYAIFDGLSYKSSGAYQQSVVQHQIINNALRDVGVLLVDQQVPDAVVAQFKVDGDAIERVTFDLNRRGKKVDEKIFSFVRYDAFLHPYAKKLKVAGFILAALCVIVFFGYQSYQAKLEAERELAEKNKDPDKGVRLALEQTGVNPKIHLAYLAIEMFRQQTLTGYKVTHIETDGRQLTVSIESDNGRQDELINWAKKSGYQMGLLKDALMLARPLRTMPVLKKAVLPPIESVVMYVNKAVESWWDKAEVSSDTSVSEGWVERVVRISVTDWTAYDFDTLGSLLVGLPIAVTKISLDVRNGELYSGTLEFVAYGRKN